MRWLPVHFYQEIGLIDDPDGAPAFVDHRKLRHIRVAHSLECREQRIIRAHCDHFASFIPMRDQIAQIAVWWTMNESLLGHPKIVIHLRWILVAGIRNECD